MIISIVHNGLSAQGLPPGQTGRTVQLWLKTRFRITRHLHEKQFIRTSTVRAPKEAAHSYHVPHWSIASLIRRYVTLYGT